MNRKSFLKHTAGSVILLGAPVLNSLGRESKKENNYRNKIIREGHRGFCQYYPENTLTAFEEAITAGVDRIEMDLRLSADGHPVIIHDDSINRTTDKKGAVSAMTLKELKALDAGSWKSPKFKGLTVPTLEEVFSIAKGNCFVNIDLKDANAVPAMVRLAEKMDMIDQIVITGKIPECTDAIRKENNSITMFYELPDDLAINHPKQAIKNIRKKQLPGSLINIKAANKTFIKESKLHGLSVSVWGVLTENDMVNLIEMGVDSIMTDKLHLLNKVLNNNETN